MRSHILRDKTADAYPQFPFHCLSCRNTRPPFSDFTRMYAVRFRFAALIKKTFLLLRAAPVCIFVDDNIKQFACLSANDSASVSASFA